MGKELDLTCGGLGQIDLLENTIRLYARDIDDNGCCYDDDGIVNIGELAQYLYNLGWRLSNPKNTDDEKIIWHLTENNDFPTKDGFYLVNIPTKCRESCRYSVELKSFIGYDPYNKITYFEKGVNMWAELK